MPLPPADQYRARAEARRATRDALNRQDLRLSQLRLVAFGSAVALGVFAALVNLPVREGAIARPARAQAVAA